MSLIICPQCNGFGFEGRRVCRDCRGAGRGLMFGSCFLYWGRALSDFDIKIRRFKNLIDDIVNALALAAALGAAAVFFYFLYGINFQGIETLRFWTSDEGGIRFFYLAVLVFLFLIYRLRLLTSAHQQVLKRKYGEEALELRETSWEESKKISGRSRIDVSKSFSHETLRAIEDAYLLAKKWKHSEVNLLHLFAALLRTRKAQYVFIRLDPDKYRNIMELARRALVRETPTVGAPKVNSRVYEILIRAYVNSYEEREDTVAIIPALLLLGLEDKSIGEMLYDLGIDEQMYKNTVAWIRNSEKLRLRLVKFRARARLKPRGAMDRAMTALATPNLDRWSQDLTRFASYGYLPPIVGREEQFDAIFRIIESGRGVILVGLPGVGKGAIIEGLALRMAEEDVPRLLYDKRLLVLNVADLVSGSAPGEAGERMLAIFNDIARSRNIVLYVPHVERLIGARASAGGGEGADLAALLANEVGRGYFICFASADSDAYRAHVEGSALRGVFEKIEVPEPKKDLAIQIIQVAALGLEGKNKVFFSYDAILKSVTLSDRYLHERYLPAKALEVLREAAAVVRQKKGVNKFVRGEDVAEIIAQKTKIPVTAITAEEGEKFSQLEEKMHRRVIGQDEAVSAVARALRRARAELREVKRPIANFLFLGPTGVGKTETAKAVAHVYFDSEKNMVRLDMSEYQDKASIHRMIGVPGEKGGGLLTEAVRNEPFTLLLLDEIEKAHPDILNLFLQVMDDGRLTDNEGRTVDFTNVILIATSNAGTPFIQGEVQKNTPIEQIKDRLVREELKGVFRPEFLNRFDGVIVFKPLTLDEIQQITWLMLGRVTRQLEEKGIDFEATDAAVRELAQAGFDPIFGARPLRRVIQEKVEDAIARLLLEQKLSRRDKIIYDADNQVRVEKAKQL